MNKNRLEAFSDGVLAIIITIMVLELKIPHNPTWQSYVEAYPIFASYTLSYVFVGLYWSNHHHLLHAANTVNNKVLWFNMFSLFGQSLIPFATASMGENHFTSITVTIYALVMTFCTVAHILLVNSLCKEHGRHSDFAKRYKGHSKTYITIGVNFTSAIIAYCNWPKVAFCLMVLMALSWFLPNHQLEKK